MSQEIQPLIDLARHGDETATGRLLAAYGEYLKLLARVQVGRRLQGKLDASDLVQETFMDAHRQMAQFRGTTEAELLAWLRKILAGHVAMTVRRYFGAQGRDINLERGIAAQIDASSQAMDGGLIGSNTTPSQHAFPSRAVRTAGRCIGPTVGRLSRGDRPATFGGAWPGGNRRPHGTEPGQRAEAVRAGPDESPASDGERAMKMNNNRFDGMEDPDTTQPSPTTEDPRLLRAVEEYLAALESGRRPNRQEILSRHPDIADDLIRVPAGPGICECRGGPRRCRGRSGIGPPRRKLCQASG